MWVFRAGKDGALYDCVIKNSQVFLPWDGYHEDLSNYETMSEFRKLVEREKGTTNRTSVSNWASQLMIFAKTSKAGDCVLIPAHRSKHYTLAKISGDYEYIKDNEEMLRHTRKIIVIDELIPREVFSQEVKYMLGAYRTVFKIKNEGLVLQQIEQWRSSNSQEHLPKSEKTISEIDFEL